MLLYKLFSRVFWTVAEVCGFVNGGGGEIRTHGRVTPTAVFKTAALNQLGHTSLFHQLRIIPFSADFG